MGYRVSHPSLEPRPTGTLAPANSGRRGHHRSRPILGRRLPEKDVTDARAKVHCPADGERIDVEWSFLEPSGVVGDENERAEMDLAAFNQSAGGNHDDENRKKSQLHQKFAKTPAHGGRQLSWI